MNKRNLVLQTLLVVISLFLLGSLGGAGAIGAPILLPLQFLAARSSRSTAMRVVWAVLAAITAAEAAWVLTFLALGESEPLIWILPSLAAAVAATLIVLGSRRS